MQIFKISNVLYIWSITSKAIGDVVILQQRYFGYMENEVIACKMIFHKPERKKDGTIVNSEFVVSFASNPLNANPTTWPDTLKQFVGNTEFMFTTTRVF